MGRPNARPAYLRLCVPASPPSAPGARLGDATAAPLPPRPTGLRPEHLSEREFEAIWALVRAGKLPPDATASVWAGEPPPRWTRGQVALGLAAWAAVGSGLWSIVA